MERNSFSTRAIRLGQDPDEWEIGCPVAPPLIMSSTYHYRDGPEGVFYIAIINLITELTFHLKQAYVYSQVGSVTRNTLEKVLASLEGAKYDLSISY